MLLESRLIVVESRQLPCLYDVVNAESVADNNKQQPDVEKEDLRI